MRRKRKISEVIWKSFAEVDDRYLDLFRVGYALGITCYLGLSIAAAFNLQPWDPVAFGTGFGAILFGGGVGVGLRGKFEDGTQKHLPTIEPEEPENNGYQGTP